MFWSKKKKAAKAAKKKEEHSRQLREEAMANMRAARAHIGEDTLDRIAAAMERKQNSVMEQAKSQIASADADRVAGEILYMLDQRK